MLDEDEKLHAMYLKEETKDEQGRMEEEARWTREREIDKMWKALEAEDAEEKKRMIVQLMEAAVIRGTRGKKKKGRKGGKGKKKK